MFYACAAGFDVTRNLEKFLDFGWKVPHSGSKGESSTYINFTVSRK
jgi:hypothetical protein